MSKYLLSNIPDIETLYSVLNNDWNNLWTTNFENNINLTKYSWGHNNLWNFIVMTGFLVLSISTFFLYYINPTLVHKLFLIEIFLFILTLSLFISPFIYIHFRHKGLQPKIPKNSDIEIKKMITQCITKIFGHKVTYLDTSLNNKEVGLEIHKQLKKSMLIDATQSIRHITNVGCIYQIPFDNFEVRIAECSVLISQTHAEAKYSLKPIMNGYFSVIPLTKKLKSRTFLSTNKTAYGNDFKNENNNPKEIQLEWNDFNNLIKVSTTNGIEARYILTPDFMKNIYEWWEYRHESIRISFIDDKMYVIWEKQGIHLSPLYLDNVRIFLEIQLLSEKILSLAHLIEALPIHLVTIQSRSK